MIQLCASGSVFGRMKCPFWNKGFYHHFLKESVWKAHWWWSSLFSFKTLSKPTMFLNFLVGSKSHFSLPSALFLQMPSILWWWTHIPSIVLVLWGNVMFPKQLLPGAGKWGGTRSLHFPCCPLWCWSVHFSQVGDRLKHKSHLPFAFPLVCNLWGKSYISQEAMPWSKSSKSFTINMFLSLVRLII